VACFEEQCCGVVWTDERHGHRQLYFQTGAPGEGIRMAPSDHDQLAPCASHSGCGTLVVWSEDRGTGTGPDIYAQRCLGTSRDPRWPESGLLVCGEAGPQVAPAVRQDIDGNTFLVWQDGRNGNPDIYAQRLRCDATVAEGWPAGGLAVSVDPRDDAAPQVCGAPGFDWPWVVEDAYVVWTREGVIMAQWLSSSGSVGEPNWPAAGCALSDTAYAAANPVMAGPVVVEYWYVVAAVWEELRGGQRDLYGAGLCCTAPPAESFVVASLPGSNQRNPRAVVCEGAFRVAWEDDRSDASDIYGQCGILTWKGDPGAFDFGRVCGDTGCAVCSAPGRQDHIAVGPLADHIFWEDRRAGEDQPRIYGNSVHFCWGTEEGFVLDPASGAQVSPSTGQWSGNIPENYWDYSLVAWTDYRNPETAPDVAVSAVPMPPSGVESPAVARASLSRPMPMPFTGSVGLTLSLPQDADVELEVVDLAGRLVCSLARGRLAAGAHDVRWDGRDASGASAASGVYWIRGTANGVPLASKLVRLR
jgi:hypothetical protein